MNNNKGKIIMIVVLAIILFTALGYYISFNLINKEEPKTNGNLQAGDNIAIESNENVVKANSNVEQKEDTEKYENVVLTSKIGTKVLSNFGVSNIYSNFLYTEMDNNGLSNDAKLMYTYITINSKYDYHTLIKSSEELGEYIPLEDFEKVYKKLFGSNSTIAHNSIINENTYDAENKCYKCIAFGVCGNDLQYTIEVPYEIREYEDRVEALFYRIYATANASVDEEGNQSQKVDLFADSQRSNKLYTGNDEKLQFNDGQDEYIMELIDKGELNKDELKKVTYTLKPEGEEYYIFDVK